MTIEPTEHVGSQGKIGLCNLIKNLKEINEGFCCFSLAQRSQRLQNNAVNQVSLRERVYLRQKMDDPVFCSQKHNAARCMRWAILVLPLLFAGCFDGQSDSKGKEQKSGIAAISRYFSFNQSSSSEKSKEAAVTADPQPLPGNISESQDFDQRAAELGIAMPSFIESSRALSNNGPKGDSSSIADLAKFMRRRNSSNESSAANLSSSFNRLFASVFGSSKIDEPALFAKDELSNPFTEARQKQESSASQSSDAKTDANANKSQSKKQASATGDTKTGSNDSQAIITGSGIPTSNRFLIVGDFDGSGVLKTAFAERASDTRFVTEDGARDFNLYINSAPVEQHRAFCIDDVNGDGYWDLLVTSESWLFGSVMLGDGHGSYQYFDSFVTGYAPTIPAAGPFHGDMREILTVNMRSGALNTFRSAKHYRAYQTALMSFVPNYLLHMVAPDSSLDYLLFAYEQGPEQIYGWGIDNTLMPTTDRLGADPTVLSSGLGSYSLQAYQVGSYASIVMKNGGASFNVVNMRVHPHIFIIIGDLQEQGFKDVAVANLLAFTPKNSH
jgi:hypothetical protein